MDDRYAVRLTRAAFRDLDEIADHVAQTRGLDEAQSLGSRLVDHLAHLDHWPMRGPVPKELDGTGRSDIRQTIFGPLRIFYSIAGSSVSVFLIADGRRDIPALLTRRLLER